MKNWAEKNKILAGQIMSLIGLGGMLYMATIAGFVKNTHVVCYMVCGWTCGALTVGGVAYVIIKELEEKIEKFQNKKEQDAE